MRRERRLPALWKMTTTSLPVWWFVSGQLVSGSLTELWLKASLSWRESSKKKKKKKIISHRPRSVAWELITSLLVAIKLAYTIHHKMWNDLPADSTDLQVVTVLSFLSNSQFKILVRYSKMYFFLVFPRLFYHSLLILAILLHFKIMFVALPFVVYL